jgi:hypothetical protein
MVIRKNILIGAVAKQIVSVQWDDGTSVFKEHDVRPNFTGCNERTLDEAELL